MVKRNETVKKAVKHESKKEARSHEHRGMEHYERGPVKHHAKKK